MAVQFCIAFHNRIIKRDSTMRSLIGFLPKYLATPFKFIVNAYHLLLLIVHGLQMRKIVLLA